MAVDRKQKQAPYGCDRERIEGYLQVGNKKRELEHYEKMKRLRSLGHHCEILTFKSNIAEI